jgi:hypothetical protein
MNTMSSNQERNISQSYENAGREYASMWGELGEEAARAAAEQDFSNDPREYEFEDWADYRESFVSSYVTGFNAYLSDMSVARVKELVSDDSGMEYEFPHNGHMAYASYDFMADKYGISYHNGMMPAYLSQDFETIEALVAKMKELSGDLSKWQVSVSEE